MESVPAMKETESNKDNLLSENRASTPSSPSDAPITQETLARQVDARRQEEIELQRRKEELERERNEVEELRRKLDECVLGREEMLERLTRGLVLLEHEQVETQRKTEHLGDALRTFRTRKEELESIRNDHWNDANIKAELPRALAIVDSARNDFNHYRARLDVLDEKRNPDAAVGAGSLAQFGSGENPLSKLKFGDLLVMGFALSLPLLILGLALLAVLLSRK